MTSSGEKPLRLEELAEQEQNENKRVRARIREKIKKKKVANLSNKQLEEYFIRKSSKQQRAFLKDVFRQTVDLLDMDLKDYEPEYNSYKDFSNGFVDEIFRRLDGECVRHASLKLIRDFKRVGVSQESEQYKALREKADAARSPEQYDELEKIIGKESIKIILGGYRELRQTLENLKSGNIEEAKDLFIHPSFLGTALNYTLDSFRTEAEAFHYPGDREVTRAGVYVRDGNINIVQALKNLSESFLVSLVEDIEKEVVDDFLAQRGLGSKDLEKIQEGKFNYKLNNNIGFFKDVYKGIFEIQEDKQEIREKVIKFIDGVSSAFTQKRKKLTKGKIIGSPIVHYINRTKKLDEVLNELTREICATECHNWKRGCCDGQHFDRGISFELKDLTGHLQVLQALKNGWQEKNKEDRMCKYHSKEGCKLDTLKTPLCIGYVCYNLNLFLAEELGIKDLHYAPKKGDSLRKLYDDFITSMGRVSGGILSLDQDDSFFVFSNLDKAIRYGKELIKIKKAAKKRT